LIHHLLLYPGRGSGDVKLSSWYGRSLADKRILVRLEVKVALLLSLPLLTNSAIFNISLSGPHKCNTTTIQLQYKIFFLYCSCIALVRTPATQRCNTSFLQLAENLQATTSLSGNMLMSKTVAANQRSVLRVNARDHIRKMHTTV